MQENISLRQKLESLTAEDRSHSNLHIEAKLKAFQYEEERDRMYEKLEKIKRKYNQLHEAYTQKVKRCKALEEVFSRQKTLNGLVMKSAVEQTQRGKINLLSLYLVSKMLRFFTKHFGFECKGIVYLRSS